MKSEARQTEKPQVQRKRTTQQVRNSTTRHITTMATHSSPRSCWALPSFNLPGQSLPRLILASNRSHASATATMEEADTYAAAGGVSCMLAPVSRHMLVAEELELSPFLLPLVPVSFPSSQSCKEFLLPNLADTVQRPRRSFVSSKSSAYWPSSITRTSQEVNSFINNERLDE